MAAQNNVTTIIGTSIPMAAVELDFEYPSEKRDRDFLVLAVHL